MKTLQKHQYGLPIQTHLKPARGSWKCDHSPVNDGDVDFWCDGIGDTPAINNASLYSWFGKSTVLWSVDEESGTGVKPFLAKIEKLIKDGQPDADGQSSMRNMLSSIFFDRHLDKIGLCIRDNTACPPGNY